MMKFPVHFHYGQQFDNGIFITKLIQTHDGDGQYLFKPVSAKWDLLFLHF